jgi:disease resistance protein RPM1
MHALSIIKTLLGVLQYQINMIKEDKLLSIQLKIGLRCLKDELQTMTKRVEEYDEFQLQELAYDIEDFTDGLWVPKSFGSVLSAIGMNPKDEHVQLINDFKERMKNLEKHPPKSSELASSGTTSSTAGAAGSPYTPNVDLVGIDTPLDVLLELLSPLPSEKHQLRVISIVGCRGIGKTALARAVYDDPHVSEAFNCTAWVQASDCSHVRELLDKVLEAVTTKDTPSATLDDILKHKRLSLS